MTTTNNTCPKCGAARDDRPGVPMFLCGSQPDNDVFQSVYCRVRQLENAIRTHRSQKADDRCIEDDDRLYEALGDGVKCDRRVGDQCAMLANCKRFIENRTEGGGWPTYSELEKSLADMTAARDRCLRLISKACDSREAFKDMAVELNAMAVEMGLPVSTRAESIISTGKPIDF